MTEDKPRYSRISDILDLIVLMQSKVLGVTLSDISERFHVSRRTAERLRDAVINIIPQINEIETLGKEKHWGFMSGYMNEIITFTPEEIAILENIKDGLRTDLNKETLESVITKLKAHSRKQMTKVDDAIELIMKSEGMAVTQKPCYKIDVHLFDTIRQAIKQNKKLSCKYDSKEKVLAPYGIIYGSNAYLIGVEGNHEKPYVYSLHKFSDIKLTSETFDKGDFDIKDYANQSFGVYQNELMKVELLFTPEVAEDVLNFNFHPTQKVKQNDDGSVTVKFKASGELEILWHIFKWGENVKIVTPTKLKKMYVEYLKNVLNIYNGK
ncbi:WYL domain-containing protein [bacterium]|nr:WYL domain-containing protein [bacterium]